MRDGGTLGPSLMDEHEEPLKHRTPLLPTRLPHGVDEAPPAIRPVRQTRQVPQPIGHEDQTPRVANGLGTPHAIRVETQRPLAILITRFRRPPVSIQAE